MAFHFQENCFILYHLVLSRLNISCPELVEVSGALSLVSGCYGACYNWCISDMEFIQCLSIIFLHFRFNSQK